MQGKDEECKDMATKALRLEGSLTKTKRVEAKVIEADKAGNRADTYGRTVFRRTDNVHPDDVPSDQIKKFTMDKTKTYNFKC